jgi:hypothetical protein
VKQVIEGKAAPKALKTQSDAVVTMGTNQGENGVCGHGDVPGIGNPRPSRSGQTNEISLAIASFFRSCSTPAHNANAPVFRGVVQAIKIAPASHAPPPNNAASDGELLSRGSAMLLRLEYSTECRTSHSLVGHFVRVV